MWIGCHHGDRKYKARGTFLVSTCGPGSMDATDGWGVMAYTPDTTTIASLPRQTKRKLVAFITPSRKCR